MTTNNKITLLKTKRFLPLFITQFLGAFNDNVFKNSLVILITYRLATNAGMNAQVLVTLASAIFILPYFLFSVTAGELADKYEKSRLITFIKAIEIGLMILAGVGFYLQSVTLLMFVLFLLGTHSTFFGPLKYAMLPEQLPENELIEGNGLIEAGTFISILLGTIFGGALIMTHSGEMIISCFVILVAIGGYYASRQIPNTHVSDPNVKISRHIFKETYKLIEYTSKQWDIFLSILGISWFWMFAGTILIQLPLLSKDVLGADNSVITYFLTLFSIGLAIGSVLCNKLLKGKVHATYVPIGVLGMSITTIDLYFSASHSTVASSSLINIFGFLSTFNGWHISIDLLLTAICGGIYTIPLYAIMQHRSEESHRARTIAANNIMNAIFMVAASLGTMFLLTIGVTVTKVFLILAIINSILAVYICKLLPSILIKSFFHWLLKTLYRVEVHGLRNYRAAGERTVIIANHTSYLDALLLGAFFPDKLTFAVNTQVSKKWWINLFLRLVDAYPIDPTKPMALKSLVEYVRKDKRCVIFPEGRLTTTGALMKIYEGPGLIADKSGANLLPVRIEGAQHTVFSRLRGKVPIQLFPKITITIFPPQILEVDANIKGRLRRQELGLKLYDLMTKVMFQNSNYKKTLFNSLIDAQSIHSAQRDILEDIDRMPINLEQTTTRSFILGRQVAKSTQMGEYVGLLLPNMNSTVITFFALQAYSRVPAMLNYSAGSQSILTACLSATIKTVITSRRFIERAKLSAIIETLNTANINVLYLEDIRDSIAWHQKFLGSFMSIFPRLTYKLIHARQNCQHYLDPNNPAVVLFTSGSEGTPKGVVLSHVNLQANRFQLGSRIDFNTTDIVFNALPIFHSFGLTAGLLLPILSGVKVFLYPSPLHYRIIPELIYDSNSTIVFGTDTFLAGYAKKAHPYDFYSIRYAFSGAEKLRDQTRQHWVEKFGVRILEGYGATETSPVIAMNTPMQNKVGSAGRLLPGIDYKISPVPGIDDGGVLHVSGPNIMSGYLLANNPGKIIPCEDGWYDTGDVVTIDGEGYVKITGRIKRFAKVAGEMVSLSKVEQEVNALWPTTQHAITYIPDDRKGEEIVLVTTYKEANRAELLQHAKSRKLSDISIPKRILIIDKIPLLGSGKTDYTKVKEFVLSNV